MSALQVRAWAKVGNVVVGDHDGCGPNGQHGDGAWNPGSITEHIAGKFMRVLTATARTQPMVTAPAPGCTVGEQREHLVATILRGETGLVLSELGTDQLLDFGEVGNMRGMIAFVDAHTVPNRRHGSRIPDRRAA